MINKEKAQKAIDALIELDYPKYKPGEYVWTMTGDTHGPVFTKVLAAQIILDQWHYLFSHSKIWHNEDIVFASISDFMLYLNSIK